MSEFRIGHGFDVHEFMRGKFIMMGGVEIPYLKSFKAHSDGDVLIHAVCDALLGAAGLGDIGQHFPDTDPQYRGISSRILLVQVSTMLRWKGFKLGNLDITIIAEQPKMMPHIDAIKINLAEDCEAEATQINVKATTTEKLGYIGREEGIAVHCIALIQKE